MSEVAKVGISVMLKTDIEAEFRRAVAWGLREGLLRKPLSTLAELGSSKPIAKSTTNKIVKLP